MAELSPPASMMQVERDWQWKLESKEQEVASLTARTRQVGVWGRLPATCGLVPAARATPQQGSG